MKNLKFITLLIITVLISTFINAQTIPTEGLVGYWPFNGNAIDGSTSGYDGVVYGASLVADRHGNLESAYYFDGVNDYIRLSNTNIFDFAQNQDFSVSFWVKSLGTQSNHAGLITNGEGSQYMPGWSIRYLNGPVSFSVSNGVDPRISTGCAECLPVQGEWHHILLVVDRDATAKIYYDGQHVTASDLDVSNFNVDMVNDKYIEFGKWYTYYFKGELDDIMVYNRILTETEIQTLYTGETSTSTTSLWDQNGSDIFNINDGNVGIGTSTPDNKLHVFDGESGGSSFINSTLTLEKDANNFLQFLTPNTNIQGVLFGDPEQAYAGYLRYNHSDNSMRLWTNNSEKLAILSNGNVGIGESNPSEELEVNGDILLSGVRPILLNSGSGYIEFTAPSGGWVLGSRYKGYDGTDHGGWRAYGSGDILNYYYVGSDYTNPLMAILPNGNIGIGTKTPGIYKLAVDGKVICEEVKVEMSDLWADFVFEQDYNLMTLADLKEFIKTNKHLPEIPTTAEVEENGISVGEMNAKLLQKIEELTLYTIQQKDIVDNQQSAINNQQEIIKDLLERVEKLENK